MLDSFWIKLRLYWLAYVISFSFIIGLALTFIVTLVTWMSSGHFSLQRESLDALFDIASFWFKLAWTVSFLIALILSFKYIFNKEISGLTLYLMECKTKEPFNPVILLDVLPIWRKFLFMIIWVLLVVALLLLGLLGMDKTFFGGSTLFVLILLFGALLLPLMLRGVKNVRRSDDLRLKARK